uniref:Nitric oxide synthase-interacting protein n=1 Tax=Petromyzon marinus TaxID=7757 RepID=A0AAJ7SSM1_PETMA|nr:nitric oxide synthase-interacting protein [Petromyzon marinus]XP_032804837.1 nitric oxide synthase-interacting protein [Petromyzon marinus]
MTRHGRNCTAGAVYTYYEKKKDTAVSGYGTQRARLSKDSIKDFDCCCLSLQPCKEPVVTPDGFLYEKEAILEYILHQKCETVRKTKLYEKQKKKKSTELQELAKAEKESKVKAFLAKEGSIISKPLNPFAPKSAAASAEEPAAGSSSSSSAKANLHDKQLPSFWIPSLTPEAKATELKKPDKNVYCPMSGRPLRLKDLYAVKFTAVNDRDTKTALISKQERFVCAVTNDVLSNSVPCAVLRPSGAVVTMECVERLIRKDMIDPTTGEALSEKDIIQLQRGGTGFSGSGVALEAQEARPVMMA